MRRQSIPLRSEWSHRGDDACDCIVYIILHIVYVEYFVMYIFICINFEKELRGL